MKTHHVRIGLR